MAAEPIPAQIIASCAAVRQATPADAVAGVQPRLVAAPASTSEASTLLRAADELGLAVIFRGTGSRLHWGNPPERCDLVVETTQLDEIVEHAAGDLVATVQAGVRLDRLADVLAAAGQRLALDPPARRPAAGDREAGQGTVGGVLATGAAGPLRLRYGTGRDLLIGITVVRADGTIARSGGKVVKNVAGYDLGKLFAGSRGTLGLITQATFRLHPLPAQTVYVSAACADPAGACAVLDSALASKTSPVSAEIYWQDRAEPIRACVALEGDPASAADRAVALAGVLASDAGGVRARRAAGVVGRGSGGPDALAPCCRSRSGQVTSRWSSPSSAGRPPRPAWIPRSPARRPGWRTSRCLMTWSRVPWPNSSQPSGTRWNGVSLVRGQA